MAADENPGERGGGNSVKPAAPVLQWPARAWPPADKARLTVASRD